MVILNKFVVVVVVVDFFRLDIILHFRDRAFCTLTTFYYRDGILTLEVGWPHLGYALR